MRKKDQWVWWVLAIAGWTAPIGWIAKRGYLEFQVDKEKLFIDSQDSITNHVFVMEIYCSSKIILRKKLKIRIKLSIELENNLSIKWKR